MYMFLMMLCVVGAFIGLFWTILGIVEDGKDSLSYLWIPILMSIAGIFGGYQIVTNDPIRVVNGDGVVIAEYAKVTSLSTNRIQLDNKNWKTNMNNVAAQKYPINFDDIKEGDIVRYEIISTDFSEYLIKIEKVK